jgi:hypothetical protein
MAAGGGAPVTTRQVSRTTLGYDPSQALAETRQAAEGAIKQRVKLGLQEAGVLEQERAERERILGLKEKYIGRALEQNKAALAQLRGSGKDKGVLGKVQDRITKADNILGNIRGKISKIDLQPSISTGRTIAFAIAAAFSGFAAGFRGTSGNAALSMMQTYVNNQMKAKKAQIDKLKDLHKLTRGQRDYLDDVLNIYRKKEEKLLLERAQYDLAKLALPTESLGIQLKKANGVLKIQKEIQKRAEEMDEAQKKLKLQYKTKTAPVTKETKVTKPSSLREFMIKERYKARLKDKAAGPGQYKGVSSELKTRFLQGVNVMKRLDEIKALHKKYQPWRGVSWLGSAKSRLYNARLADYLAAETYFRTGKAATELERKGFQRQISEGIVPLPFVGESFKSGQKKMELKRQAMVGELADFVRMFPQLAKALPTGLRKEVLRAIGAEQTAANEPKLGAVK